MVAVKKNLLEEIGIQSDLIQQGSVLSVASTALDVIGKLGVTIGTTGILLYAFGFIEAFFAFGTLSTGALMIATGLASGSIANKVKTGNWFKGLLA